MFSPFLIEFILRYHSCMDTGMIIVMSIVMDIIIVIR